MVAPTVAARAISIALFLFVADSFAPPLSNSKPFHAYFTLSSSLFSDRLHLHFSYVLFDNKFLLNPAFPVSWMERISIGAT